MQRCFTNILSASVDDTATFYEQVLGMNRHFDSDWFVVLTHKAMPSLELGILQRTHDIVPDTIKNPPTGVMITFVVDDCSAIHTQALKHGVKIIEPPTDMPYGQRRMLLLDPDGTMVDVSSPTPNAA